MTCNLKDVAAGIFFVLVGLLYGSLAWLGLPIGEALNMGPGYFPIFLSVMLALLGLGICFQAFIHTERREPFGKVPWRGIICLSGATILFAAFVENIGLLPGVFISTFIATLAEPKVKLVRALLGSAGIALFCTAVFGYGIRLPLPIVGEWLGG